MQAYMCVCNLPLGESYSKKKKKGDIMALLFSLGLFVVQVVKATSGYDATDGLA
jgi:hypothetical protein